VTTLPTGEKLPDYDDGPADGVDTHALHRWLTARSPLRWDSNPAALNLEHDLIRDVLAALQAVGDATLVKNGTYRMMRRDGADIEALAAYLTREGYAGPLVEHGGNPVKTIIAVIGTDG
jgi:hypothetical protein